MKERVAAGVLVVLGLAQMLGDLADLPLLKGVAAATNASPAPKVFSSVRGLETFSSRFTLSIRDARGGSTDVPLTPERYARLAGPYNRRNAYGAALAYGPVLSQDPRTAPMLEAITRYAFCEPGRLPRELGLTDAPARHVLVNIAPKAGTEPDQDLPRSIEVDCRG